MYTPPSERGSLEFPSALGGGNWGGAAYDPERNLLIVKGENLASIIRLVKKKDPAAEDKIPPADYLTRPLIGTPYRVEGEVFMSPVGVPCTPPPWGTLTAIDMATGKQRWQVPFGQAIRAGILVPESLGWGAPNAGGPMLTGGGLLFVGATVDSKFRAFDTDTGKKLWETSLPVPGMAVPMTYEVGGRQFVVIAAGGHSLIKTKVGDSLIAYALPPSTAGR
jgi:quinoprotein glucose dehydrogenase